MNIKKAKEDCIKWMRDWYDSNGKGCNIIVGISGGIDSSVVAALCVEAFGKDKVIGVLMPNGAQTDIVYAYELVGFLNIEYFLCNIGDIVFETLDVMKDNLITPSEQTKINLPPRIRMALLYAIAQSENGRVVNTCNLSEDYIGYSTRWGDSAGDFAPIADFTKTEVKLLGYELNLPENLVEKTPTDGLCGKTDEENFGFTYEVLDTYIRTGVCEDKRIKDAIDYMHEKNKFKEMPIPKFKYKEEKMIINENIVNALTKALMSKGSEKFIKRELKSCTKQIKDALGVDVVIVPVNEVNKLNKLSSQDIESVGRNINIQTGKIETKIKYKDGTETSVVLNEFDDYDDPEKAIMWCLLKKCFKSKRSLEKVIYALNNDI